MKVINKYISNLCFQGFVVSLKTQSKFILTGAGTLTWPYWTNCTFECLMKAIALQVCEVLFKLVQITLCEGQDELSQTYLYFY